MPCLYLQPPPIPAFCPISPADWQLHGYIPATLAQSTTCGAPSTCAVNFRITGNVVNDINDINYDLMIRGMLKHKLYKEPRSKGFTHGYCEKMMEIFYVANCFPSEFCLIWCDYLFMYNHAGLLDNQKCSTTEPTARNKQSIGLIYIFNISEKGLCCTRP